MNDRLALRQVGQAMVEYTVILLALTAALLAPSLWRSSGGDETGVIGLDQSQRGSVLRAVANKHRGYGYALSLSEIPEMDGPKQPGQAQEPLMELADYYDSLGKYPKLSPQLRAAGGQIGTLTSQVNGLTSQLTRYVPPNWRNICGQLQQRLGSGVPFAPTPPGC